MQAITYAARGYQLPNTGWYPSIRLRCLLRYGRGKNSVNRIEGVGTDKIKLRVRASSNGLGDEGTLQKSVRELLSETLGVPKSDIKMTKGSPSDVRTVEIRGTKVLECGESLIPEVKAALDNAAKAN